MDSNAFFAILLLIVGLAVLTAEVFIPTGGLLGVITFLTLILSLVFGYKAWGTSHPNVFWAFCVMLLLLVPTVIGLAFYALSRTALGKRLILDAPIAEDLKPYPKESERLTNLIGRFGSALTLLNPGGLVRVDGQRLHALSDGLFIEAGASVQIVNLRGSSVVVRPKTEPVPESNDTTSSGANVEARDPSTLDFEFPTT